MKNSSRITIRVSNILDPDQARFIVGPDLVVKLFAIWLSAYDSSRQIVCLTIIEKHWLGSLISQKFY